MANSITLVKQFVKMLDEAYKLASLTSDLDGCLLYTSDAADEL